MSEKKKRLYTIPQAADQIGVSRGTLYLMRQEGKLRTVKLRDKGVEMVSDLEIERIVRGEA